MTLRSRLEKSLITGLAAGAVVAGFAATRRHAALAAAAARSTAHGQPESVTGLLVTGFTATAVIVAVLVFTIATMAAIRRRRRLLQQYYRGGAGARRVYSGSGHWGRW